MNDPAISLGSALLKSGVMERKGEERKADDKEDKPAAATASSTDGAIITPQ